MRAAIVDENGTLLERSEAPTPRDTDPEPLLTLVKRVLRGDSVDGAVVGVPGWVDYARGALEHAPNLPTGWIDDLTADAIADRIGVPVSLANDADLAAVGEAYFGAGRDADDVAYLTVSTGIGAGVVLGGRLVAGRRSLAEFGHTVIDWDAAPGAPSTLEALGSGTSLGRRARAAGLPEDGAEIVRRLKAGEAAPRRVWEEMLAAVQVGVTNLAWVFMPEVIVLGGGVGLNGDLLIEPLLSGETRSRGQALR